MIERPHRYKLVTTFLDGRREVAIDLPEIIDHESAKLGVRRLVEGWMKLDLEELPVESIKIWFGGKLIEGWTNDKAFSPAE